MKNKRGLSFCERLNEEISYAENIKNAEQAEVLAIKALGAADLAVEFGIITYKEWENCVGRIFNMMQ